MVGGPCEGCEALLEYPAGSLKAVDTIPGHSIYSPKVLLTGVVYRADGKNPAENVIVYAYQTNRKGIYARKENSKGWGRRHGYHRGWVKTGQDGRYTFYTFRPGAYPERNEPEHIHLVVKEPETIPYYIDDVLFLDDPRLAEQMKQALNNRAGTGLVSLSMKGSYYVAKRDIILGANIPNYPKK